MQSMLSESESPEEVRRKRNKSPLWTICLMRVQAIRQFPFDECERAIWPFGIPAGS